jgi:pimeloyl-ACP methyl ester carboxylesterase
MADWCALAEELHGDIELLAPDLPGLGRSDGVDPKPGLTLLDTAAECALTAATHLDWNDRFYVIGHSHGAGVALALAARCPDRVAGVILVSSLGTTPHTAYRQLALPGMQSLLRISAALVRRDAMRPLMLRLVASIMAPMFAPAPVSSERVTWQLQEFARRPSVLLQMARLAREAPSAQLLLEAPTVSAPVLLIHGEDDKLIPISHAQHLRALLTNTTSVRFDSVPGAGHMLHLTNAATVRRLIDAWLCGINPTTSAASTRTEQGNSSATSERALGPDHQNGLDAPQRDAT